jgi:23S rRNA (pseudouridine1915-N3)-methyltransferase
MLRTKFHIVAPWEIQPQGVFLQAIDFYFERLRNKGSCEFTALRGARNVDEDKIFDPMLVNFRRSNVAVACLDERAKALSSEDLAQWISSTQMRGSSAQAFVLGGAYGLPASLANDGQVFSFKLSNMTLPHELALLVLVEQLYRAQCILTNHPYHHGVPSAFSKTLLQSRGKP